MGRTDPGFLVVGHLDKPHGIQGEFVVSLHTDHPEANFASGVVLFPAGPDGLRPDDDVPPLRIERSRPFQRGLLVAFEGIGTRSDAEPLRGRYLLRAAEEVPPLDDGEVFQHDLIGLRARTSEGVELGTVSWVHEIGPNRLVEVRGPLGERLIPLRAEFLRAVDVEAGTIVLDPPAGLLDL